MASNQPTAIDGLDVNEVKEGLVLYDSKSDRVHYLNATASIVFTLCDGTHTTSKMADVIAAAFGLERPPITEVEECLGTLAREGLLK